jgi:hypothetical protein
MLRLGPGSVARRWPIARVEPFRHDAFQPQSSMKPSSAAPASPCSDGVVSQRPCEAGRRTVPIPSELREILSQHRARCGWSQGVAFGRTHDAPFNINGAYSRARKAWSAANVEAITLHEAWHTYASLMIAAGVNAKELATYMGPRQHHDHVRSLRASPERPRGVRPHAGRVPLQGNDRTRRLCESRSASADVAANGSSRRPRPTSRLEQVRADQESRSARGIPTRGSLPTRAPFPPTLPCTAQRTRVSPTPRLGLRLDCRPGSLCVHSVCKAVYSGSNPLVGLPRVRVKTVGAPPPPGRAGGHRQIR